MCKHYFATQSLQSITTHSFALHCSRGACLDIVYNTYKSNKKQTYATPQFIPLFLAQYHRSPAPNKAKRLEQVCDIVLLVFFISKIKITIVSRVV